METKYPTCDFTEFAAIMDNNMDRVILESGYVFEFVNGYKDESDEMIFIEKRDPLIHTKNKVHNAFGIVHIMHKKGNSYMWEY